MIRKIRISNERLTQTGESIDQWLIDNIGYGNYTEWVGVNLLPFRSFSFYDEKDEVVFILKWGG
jgi:hypothetical protein